MLLRWRLIERQIEDVQSWSSLAFLLFSALVWMYQHSVSVRLHCLCDHWWRWWCTHVGAHTQAHLTDWQQQPVPVPVPKATTLCITLASSGNFPLTEPEQLSFLVPRRLPFTVSSAHSLGLRMQCRLCRTSSLASPTLLAAAATHHHPITPSLPLSLSLSQFLPKPVSVTFLSLPWLYPIRPIPTRLFVSLVLLLLLLSSSSSFCAVCGCHCQSFACSRHILFIVLLYFLSFPWPWPPPLDHVFSDITFFLISANHLCNIRTASFMWCRETTMLTRAQSTKQLLSLNISLLSQTTIILTFALPSTFSFFHNFKLHFFCTHHYFI